MATSRSGPPNTILLAAVALVAAVIGGAVSRYVAPPAAGPSPVLAGTQGATLTGLVERTAPAVVNIAVLQPSPASQNPLLRDPFFRRYMGIPDEALQPTISAGSGVIVDAGRGLVVTNFHVIRNARAVEIGLRDERSFRAELVGIAPAVDLAVLRINARNLPALPLADSSHPAVGEHVVAIGNPFGLGQTVTAGIVSAVNRGLGPGDGRRFIQTDAPINPGNSGGPLINLRGEVVGINSALISPNEGNVGIGFAIPASTVSQVLAEARQR
jgi:S1-C subfamily serine protease